MSPLCIYIWEQPAIFTLDYQTAFWFMIQSRVKSANLISGDSGYSGTIKQPPFQVNSLLTSMEVTETNRRCIQGLYQTSIHPAVFSSSLAAKFERIVQSKLNFPLQSRSVFKIHSDRRRALNHTTSRPDCICDIHGFIMSIMLASLCREGWMKRLACTKTCCELLLQFSTAA